MTPARVAVTLANSKGQPAVAVGLNNLGTQSMKAKLSLKLPGGWMAERNQVTFGILAQGETAIQFLALKLMPGATNVSTLSVKGTMGDQSLTTERKLKVYRAPHRTVPIVLDGELTEEEYGRAPLIELNDATQLWSKDRTGWVASNGCARVRAVWDEKAIYLGVDVRDDYVQNTAPLTALFNGDCLEVYFDTATDEHMFENSLHDHQGKFLLAPAQPPEMPAARVYCRSVPPGGTIRRLAGDRAQIVSKRTPTGYTLECKIPVSDVNLSSGLIWGFDVSLIDRDGVPPNQKCYQYYWSGTGDEPYNRPHGFGFLWLVE